MMRVCSLSLVIATVATSSAFAAADLPRLGEERVLLRTNRGDLVIALYPDIAPKHTAQILKLVRLGVYDSTYIHRVEPNFVAQLTNAQNRRQPLSPEQLAAITRLPAELSTQPHRAGVLSMAREDGDLDSAETSFSFMLGPAPHLDGKYTVFGQVEFGGPLLAMISAEPRDDRNAPQSPLVIESARVAPAAEILRMRLAGELRQPQPLPASATAPHPTASRDPTRVMTVGVLLLIACNLAIFLFGPRWPPKTQGALNLLAVLIGAFLLIAQYGARGTRNPVLATVLFFGIVALLKLMNRFESAPGAGRRS
jgi:cyclophilin family peptidyl-prolyl cis-trans isomerase